MRVTTPMVICSVVCLLTAAAGGGAQSAHQDAVDAAVAAAKSWLGLVDAGSYGESWEEAAALFQGALTREQWIQSLAAARTPLGALVSRQVASARYATSLPGAPDGEYVVIQFTTVLANKKSAVETVTPMKGGDGVWRVAGYYIK